MKKQLLAYPLHLRNWALIDCHLFLNLKEFVPEKSYESQADVISAVADILKTFLNRTSEMDSIY